MEESDSGNEMGHLQNGAVQIDIVFVSLEWLGSPLSNYSIWARKKIKGIKSLHQPNRKRNAGSYIFQV